METVKMKCLSVMQPWAWLIVNGDKKVENRSWKTNYRGPLLIHATKRFDPLAMDWIRSKIAMNLLNQISFPPVYRLGHIIGIVKLIECYSPTGICLCATPSVWSRPSKEGWLLGDAVAFDAPIPYRGQFGLYNIPDDLDPQIMNGL